MTNTPENTDRSPAHDPLRFLRDTLERIATDGGWNSYGQPYSARDELRDRLNDGLQGKDPGAPINWKGLR